MAMASAAATMTRRAAGATKLASSSPSLEKRAKEHAELFGPGLGSEARASFAFFFRALSREVLLVGRQEVIAVYAWGEPQAQTFAAARGAQPARELARKHSVLVVDERVGAVRARTLREASRAATIGRSSSLVQR